MPVGKAQRYAPTATTARPVCASGWRTSRQASLPGTMYRAPTKNAAAARRSPLLDRREIPRLRPAPRSHRARKKARGSARNDDARRCGVRELPPQHATSACRGPRRAPCINPHAPLLPHPLAMQSRWRAEAELRRSWLQHVRASPDGRQRRRATALHMAAGAG
jgi:hypothetical protein